MLGEPGLSCSLQVALGWLAGQEDTRVGQKGDVFGFSGPSNSCRENVALPAPGRLLEDHAPPLLVLKLPSGPLNNPPQPWVPLYHSPLGFPCRTLHSGFHVGLSTPVSMSDSPMAV